MPPKVEAHDPTDRVKSLLSDKHELAIWAYSLILLLLMFPLVHEGIYVTDEGIYLLMVNSFVIDGSFALDRGLSYSGEGVEFVEMVDLHNGALTPQYPKLYPLLAAPFYMALGLRGLILANTFAFCSTVILVYKIARLLFSDGTIALTSAVVYSLGTYAMPYGLDVWPHAMSAAAMTAAAYYALKAVRDGSKLHLFLAGLLSSAAFGLRLQTVLFTVALSFYLYFELRRKSDALYLVLGVIPLSAVFLIFNHLAYGNPLASGYSGLGDEFGSYGYVQVFVLCSILLYSQYALGKFGLGRFWPTIGPVLVALSLCIFFALDRGVAGRIIVSAQVLFSEVAYIGWFPIASAVVPKAKMSLLQASPILALAAYGLYQMKRRGEGGFHFLLIFSTIEVLFFSARVNQHGGEMPFMRYFLQSLPYLGISAGYVIAGCWGSFNRMVGVSSALAFALLLLLSMANSGGVMMLEAHPFTHTMPLFISAALLCLAGLSEKGRNKPAMQILLVAASLALCYSLLVNVYAISAGNIIREGTSEVSGELSFVANGSVIIYRDSPFTTAYLTLLKADRDVLLVNVLNASMPGGKDAIRHYLGERSIYLIYTLHENPWVDEQAGTDDAWVGYLEDVSEEHVLEPIRRPHVTVFRVLEG